jgi:hypothetical protein
MRPSIKRPYLSEIRNYSLKEELTLGYQGAGKNILISDRKKT